VHKEGDSVADFPTLELVIARYTEDLQWIRRVPKRFAVTVYNKGSDDPSLPPRKNGSVASRPNTGREAHSFLSHIVDRYDTLAEITVFAQGRPFDHDPSFHRWLHRIAFRQIEVPGFLWTGFLIDQDDRTGSRLFRTWTKNENGRALDMNGYWRAMWDTKAPEQYTFYPGAQFAATAAVIRAHPKSWYERALRISETFPDAAHCFERTWDRVFGLCGIPTAYRSGPFPVYFRRIRRRDQDGIPPAS